MSLWDTFHEYFPFPSEHVVTWFQKAVFSMPRYSEEDFSRVLWQQWTGKSKRWVWSKSDTSQRKRFSLNRLSSLKNGNNTDVSPTAFSLTDEILVTAAVLILHGCTSAWSRGSSQLCPCPTLTVVQAALIEPKDSDRHHCLSACAPTQQRCRADGRAPWQILSFLSQWG